MGGQGALDLRAYRLRGTGLAHLDHGLKHMRTGLQPRALPRGQGNEHPRILSAQCETWPVQLMPVAMPLIWIRSIRD